MIGIYRVGDNRRTVNTSTTPHVSDQLWTENEYETLLCWFIVVIWALFSDDMYRYGRHFRSFYRNPTILETISTSGFDCLGQHGESFFIEIQQQEIILALMKNVKIKCEKYFYIPRWPAGVKSNHMVLRNPDCAITCHVSTQRPLRAAKHHRQNAYLTAMFGHYIGGYFNN